MNRRLIIGASWEEGLVKLVKEALPGWDVRTTADETDPLIKSADVLVPFGLPVRRNMLVNSHIRLIHQFGVGVDSIDLEAARELGIKVSNAPSLNSGMDASVAEGAIGLMLACARLPTYRSRNIKNQSWNWTYPLNLGLAGKRAGIIGYGSIGRAIARRLLAFDMRVCALRHSERKGTSYAEAVEWVGGPDKLPALLSNSDFIIISSPLTPETQNLVNKKFFEKIKDPAIIVNVGRGAIVNEADLIQALDDGIIYAAGLDTTRTEPLLLDSPLLKHPRIVITPHDAGATDNAFSGVMSIITENIRRMESGCALLNQIV